MRDRFELKACPFCGYEADCISEDAGWDSCGENLWRVNISCMSCGANIEIERRCDRLLRDDDIEGETCHALEELAAAMWNARSVDRDELLRIAEELEVDFNLPDENYCGTIPTEEVLEFERAMAARIKKAVGE